VLVALGTVLLAGLGVLGVREPPPVRRLGDASPRVWVTLHHLLTSRPRPWRWLLVALFLSAGARSMVETGSSSFAVFTLGMGLGDAAALRVVGVVALLLGAVPSALLAARLGRRPTVALGLLLVLLAYGATAVWVATPVAYAVVLGVAGLGGALVLVNILPLVFDLGADTQFGTYTGLAAIPVQAAAVVGPSVAGLLVEATGSQRTLFGIAAVAMGIAWVLLQRVQVETVPRSVHPGQGPGHRPLG
jgi:MFS family permease